MRTGSHIVDRSHRAAYIDGYSGHPYLPIGGTPEHVCYMWGWADRERDLRLTKVVSVAK